MVVIINENKDMWFSLNETNSNFNSCFVYLVSESNEGENVSSTKERKEYISNAYNEDTWLCFIEYSFLLYV